MKKLYLVHGWGGSDTNEGWWGWVKREAKRRGYNVISFDMPNPDEPMIEEWVGFLQDNVKDIDEETYFLGWSIGGQTIMRFLEGLPKGKKIGSVVFVAGWFNLMDTAWESDVPEEIEEEKRLAKPWIETPIDFEKIKSRANNFLAIFSEDDPCVPLSDKELFEKNLGAKTIVKSGEGHFDASEEIEEIFEIL
jgi:uncharacterized protein